MGGRDHPLVPAAPEKRGQLYRTDADRSAAALSEARPSTPHAKPALNRSCMPSCGGSMPREVFRYGEALCLQRRKQLVPRLAEGIHAFGFELLRNHLEIDPERLQRIEVAVRDIHIELERAPRLAVIQK